MSRPAAVDSLRLLAGVLVVTSLSACSETTVAPEVSNVSSRAPMAVVGAGVVQHVSVGTNDLCLQLQLPNGCDANFSLVANKRADGTVTGQWEDEFGKDPTGVQLGGVHVAIDCLEVGEYVAGIYSWPIAWVSGVITQSTSPVYSVGEGVVTVALDRGTSAQDAFDDLVGFTTPLSYAGATSCEDRPDVSVPYGFRLSGQVDIWSK